MRLTSPLNCGSVKGSGVAALSRAHSARLNSTNRETATSSPRPGIPPFYGTWLSHLPPLLLLPPAVFHEDRGRPTPSCHKDIMALPCSFGPIRLSSMA